MLTGQKKADWQKHYMRRYRAEGRDPRKTSLVRPKPFSGKTSVRPDGKTQVPGLVMDGNRGVQPVQPKRVGYIEQKGRRIEVELDADGNPIYPDQGGGMPEY